jgi:hypothetical protein
LPVAGAGFYAFSGGLWRTQCVATLDVAPGWRSARLSRALIPRGSWRWWAILALVVGLAAPTRFTTAPSP